MRVIGPLGTVPQTMGSSLLATGTTTPRCGNDVQPDEPGAYYQHQTAVVFPRHEPLRRALLRQCPGVGPNHRHVALKGCRPGSKITRCREAGAYSWEFVSTVVTVLQQSLVGGGLVFTEPHGKAGGRECEDEEEPEQSTIGATASDASHMTGVIVEHQEELHHERGLRDGELLSGGDRDGDPNGRALHPGRDLREGELLSGGDRDGDPNGRALHPGRDLREGELLSGGDRDGDSHERALHPERDQTTGLRDPHPELRGPPHERDHSFGLHEPRVAGTREDGGDHQPEVREGEEPEEESEQWELDDESDSPQGVWAGHRPNTTTVAPKAIPRSRSPRRRGRRDFWDRAAPTGCIIRRHGIPRERLYVPQELGLPIQLHQLRGVRKTVFLDRRGARVVIEDYWRIEGEVNVGYGPWTGATIFARIGYSFDEEDIAEILNYDFDDSDNDQGREEEEEEHPVGLRVVVDSSGSGCTRRAGGEQTSETRTTTAYHAPSSEAKGEAETYVGYVQKSFANKAECWQELAQIGSNLVKAAGGVRQAAESLWEVREEKDMMNLKGVDSSALDEILHPDHLLHTFGMFESLVWLRGMRDLDAESRQGSTQMLDDILARCTSRLVRMWASTGCWCSGKTLQRSWLMESFLHPLRLWTR